MKYESLILDIDGTLWDSRALVAEGYNLQLRAEGLELFCVSAEQLKPLFGKVMTEIADSIFAQVPPEQRYPLMERCMARENRYLHENPCRIGYPGVQETLEALSRNHRLFIVSNSQQGYPELCMEKLGLQDLIRAHLCFGDTGTDKGTTIRILMERQGIDSAAYIGDTEGDREAARKAGIDFLWAAYGFGTAADFAEKLNAPVDLLRLEREGRL